MMKSLKHLKDEMRKVAAGTLGIPIKLTPAAQERLDFIFSKSPATVGLVIDVKPSGCNGFSYQFKLLIDSDLSDMIYCNEYLWITKKAYPMLCKGFTLDFQRTLQEESFSIVNNAETGRCGCGESFSI